MSDEFAMARFAPALETEFVLSRPAGSPDTLTLRLVEVKKLSSSPRHEQFSMLFLGPTSPIWMQDNYKYAHPTLGEFELFTVPLGPMPGGAGYEVVISCSVAE